MKHSTSLHSIFLDEMSLFWVSLLATKNQLQKEKIFNLIYNALDDVTNLTWKPLSMASLVVYTHKALPFRASFPSHFTLLTLTNLSSIASIL